MLSYVFINCHSQVSNPGPEDPLVLATITQYTLLVHIHYQWQGSVSIQPLHCINQYRVMKKRNLFPTKQNLNFSK